MLHFSAVPRLTIVEPAGLHAKSIMLTHNLLRRSSLNGDTEPVRDLPVRDDPPQTIATQPRLSAKRMCGNLANSERADSTFQMFIAGACIRTL